MTISLIRFRILVLLGVLAFGQSCVQPRYISEQYIKNQIEEHYVGQWSSIKLMPLLSTSSSPTGGTYIEFTAVKYGDYKIMVIGADRYYKARKNFPSDNAVIARIDYIELSTADCKRILNEYNILLNRLKESAVQRNEWIYHDFTVSEDLYISLKKGKFSGQTASTAYIDFWIRGHKFRLLASPAMAAITEFLEY